MSRRERSAGAILSFVLPLLLTLFLAGILTIFLPCILPLVPIVLGVSIAGQHRLRPLVTVLGMVVGFVAITFCLQFVLMQFDSAAALIQTATYDALVLFGAGFLTDRRWLQYVLALLGAWFFIPDGWLFVVGALVINVVLLEIGRRIAPRLQQLGANVQGGVRKATGDSLFTAFVVGLTLGLVWVPCAGPALGFALALVREQPNAWAFFALTAYAVGAAVPLLIVGYGGQLAVRSMRSFTHYSGHVKRVSGVLLIFTAVALQWNLLIQLQTWLAGTPGAEIATNLEQKLFPDAPAPVKRDDGTLPDLGPAPEFTKLGPWHNSQPLDAEDLKGKVVLVDFWTYSCINCLRTLPYIQGYWDRFKTGPFVIVGVHTPEFAFEQDPDNVSDAVERLGLTYPVAQDNTYGTWRAFSNHYWPAKYLIDANGRIRYEHFGEGNYEETADAIKSLLLEAGYSFDGANMADPPPSTSRRTVTPETYLGIRGWDALANAGPIPTEDPVDYVAPRSLAVNTVALEGQWQLESDERQVLRSGSGAITIRALAGEVNLVLGPERDLGSYEVRVIVDDEETESFTVDHHDLYRLYKGPYGDHTVRLEFDMPGIAAYAYTFGQ